MSGPVISEQLHLNESDEWTYEDVNTLRELSEAVEDGELIQADEIHDKEAIAELLSLKADVIELTIKIVESQTSYEFEELVKSLQFNQTGDYGSQQVNDAWRRYIQK